MFWRQFVSLIGCLFVRGFSWALQKRRSAFALPSLCSVAFCLRFVPAAERVRLPVLQASLLQPYLPPTTISSSWVTISVSIVMAYTFRWCGVIALAERHAADIGGCILDSRHVSVIVSG